MTKGETFIPEDFRLSEATLKWIEQKHPTVDAAGTLDLFVINSQAKGRMYRDWQAGFKTWVNNAIKNKWAGCEFKQGKAADPKWSTVMAKAKEYGFREPYSYETDTSFGRELDKFIESQKRAPVLNFGEALLKRMGS